MDVFEKCDRYTRAADIRAEGIFPYFVPISGNGGTEAQIEGNRLIMMGSNNYLGLTHDPRVLEHAEKVARAYGTGCTGSRFLNGTLDLHEELERELAAFVGREKALVFSTGFQTNLGILSTLLGKKDAVVMDKYVHASIVDGVRLTSAQVFRFRHNDMEDLATTLSKVEPGHAILVAVDGVFSMEGDLANLPQILRALEGVPARLFVDEAHSLGVIGSSGRGACEHFGVADQVDLIMGTFSKSFASIGGFVAGESRVVDFIKHNARSMMYSAAMPPYAIATVQKCLDIIRTEPQRRHRLHSIWERMKKELDDLGFDTGPSESAIIPVMVGSYGRTLEFWKTLFDEGVYTNAVISPAVPESAGRLRLSFMATHTDAQLEEVLLKMKKVGKVLGII